MQHLNTWTCSKDMDIHTNPDLQCGHEHAARKWTRSMELDIYGQGHAAWTWTWTWSMDKCMLNVQVHVMSMLRVLVRAACPCPCCISMSTGCCRSCQWYLNAHATYLWPGVLHVYVHAACPVHAPCLCPCHVSLSMLYVHAHAACPGECCMFKPMQHMDMDM